MDKLKPCPFCGGEPEYERHGTNRQSCIISCLDCGARIETGETGGLEGSMWNTRTADGERTAAKARIAYFEQLAADRLAKNTADAERIAELEKALRKAAGRLERYAVQVDGEWGLYRGVAELYADGDMPEELIAISSLLNREAPCNE